MSERDARYQPDSFIAGALISLLAGLAAGVTLVRSRRRPAGAAPHDAGNDPRAAG